MPTQYQIDIHERTKAEKQKGYPYKWVGYISFKDETETGHNLIVLFVEQKWLAGNLAKNVARAFVPTLDDARLFVSATEKTLVKKEIKGAMDMIKHGFVNSNESLHKIK